MRASPLLDMPTALSRRAALFGAVTLSGTLAGSVTKAGLVNLQAALPHADVRLAILAEAMREAIEAGARAEAFGGHHFLDDPAWQDAVDSFYRAATEMRDTAAGTVAGIAAKARALRLPWLVADAETAADIGAGLAADVLRLHEGVA